MSHIKAISVRDFKKIRALDLSDADRAIVILGGKNGSGKTSALDAITVALAGGKTIPDEPIRRGADKSEVCVTLDDGVTIRRTMTRKDDGTVGGTLTIKTSDGMSPRGAQGWLDARIGNLACDPLAFMALHPEKQAAQLREIAGVDTTEIDGRRRALYDERTQIGRDGTRERGTLETMPHFPDAPKDRVVPALVSASDVLAEIAAARKTEQAAVDSEREAAAGRRDLQTADSSIESAEETVNRLRSELKRAEDVLADRVKKRAAKSEEVSRLDDAARTRRAAVVDAAPIEARLRDLERTNGNATAEAARVNAQIEANERRAAQDAKVKALREDYAAKTAAIEALDKKRADMLAAASFPVAGLGFDDAGGVTLNSLPLSQASGAERLRVSMGIALAGKPEIRVVLIRDASLLDDDSMSIVAKMADEAGAQVWMERVGDRDPGAVVIEDGGLR